MENLTKQQLMDLCIHRNIPFGKKEKKSELLNKLQEANQNEESINREDSPEITPLQLFLDITAIS